MGVVTSRKSKQLPVHSERVERNKVLLKKLDKKLPISDMSDFSSLVNFAPTSHEPFQRWFPYREGFSSLLVQHSINALPKAAVILDPFCGCGTTLIAAQRNGYEAIGFDVNPLSVLVTRAKTRKYSIKDVNALSASITAVKELSRQAESDKDPSLKIIDQIFHREILDALLRIRLWIKCSKSQKHKDFFLVAWLAILENVSNVYKEGNGIKYRNRRRTPKGYISIPLEIWQETAFPKDKHQFVLNAFTKQAELMLSDLNGGSSVSVNVRILQTSASSTALELPREAVDACIFSPPYCNCFNYFKAFKVELWMGEFVTSYEEMRHLNRSAIRSHVETDLIRTGDVNLSVVEDFAALISPDSIWDSRIPNAVRAYFIDMKQVLQNLYTLLKPGGTCTMVVGNSVYGGTVIPTDSLLATISTSLGFVVENIGIARHLTTSSQQKKLVEDRREYLRESVVILKKPNQA